ncbi:hypothetical protein HDV06_002277 [Boothiomyces sp. JEL0866]|nr:hypothetical protein HDV06_002277 [Boothiomyces sp. JEL0866]
MNQLLDNITQVATQLNQRLESLMEKLNSKELETQNGVSLLQVRIHSLLSYVTHLTYFIILKVNGKKISGHDIIKELVLLRSVLEKTKPLELKLKYQIDKLVKQAQVQVDTDNMEMEALQFKPNPSAMINSEKSEKAQLSDEVYKPPKLAPTFYDEDGKKARLTEKMRDKASKSRLLRDLRSQYDDRPEEYDAEGTGYGAREVGASKEDEQMKERETFEEENFIRLNLSKKEKKMAQKLGKQGGIMRFRNEFEDLQRDFTDISGIHHAVEVDHRNAPKMSKRKEMFEGTKRKFDDADDLISDMAQKRRATKGKDKFKSQKKIFKAFGK